MDIPTIVKFLQENLDTMSGEQLEWANNAAQLDDETWLWAGDKASLALASGIIAPDVAQDLYEIHNNFNDRSLAERMVYIECLGMLISEMAKAG